MGRGNELLRGWSEDDYQPETFFVDLTLNDEQFKNLQNDDIEAECKPLDTVEEYEQFEYDYFFNDNMHNILSELNMECTTQNIKKVKHHLHKDITFIIESEHFYFVTLGGEHLGHVSFGFLPKVVLEELYDTVDDTLLIDIIDRIESCVLHGEFTLDVGRVLQDELRESKKLIVAELYKLQIKAYKYAVKQVMLKIVEAFKAKISVRTCSWLSGLIDEKYLKDTY